MPRGRGWKSGRMTDEREITRPTDLARGRRLDPAAVGWTRTPLHRTAIAGWGRTKRWEYWGIVSDRFVVGLTVAGLDYLSTCAVYVLDRRTGVETTRSGISPLVRPAFSDGAGVGTVHASAGGGFGSGGNRDRRRRRRGRHRDPCSCDRTSGGSGDRPPGS